MKNSSKQTANPTGPCDGPLISIPLVGRRVSKNTNHETPKAKVISYYDFTNYLNKICTHVFTRNNCIINIKRKDFNIWQKEKI